MASQQQISLITILLAVLMIVGGGVVLFLMVNRVVTSVIELHRGMLLIGSGKLGEKIPVRGRDEIAELARAFNEMAERLNSSYAALKGGGLRAEAHRQ